MQSLSPQAKFVPSSAICQKKCDLDGVIPDLRGLHSQAMTSSCCDSPRSSNWYMHCLTCVNEWRASSLAEGRWENVCRVGFIFASEVEGTSFPSSFIGGTTDNTSSMVTSNMDSPVPCKDEDPSRLTVSCLFTAVLRGGGLLCVPAPEESWISFGLQWSSPQFLPSNSISHFTPFELISYTCHQNIINKLVISMVHPEPAGLLSKLLSNPRRSCWQYYLIICKNNLWEPKPMESTAVGSQKDMWANNRFQFQDNVGKKKEKDVGLDFTYPL